MDFEEITCNWLCKECGRLVVLNMYNFKKTKAKCQCGVEYIIQVDLTYKRKKND